MNKSDRGDSSESESYFDVLRQLELLTQQMNNLANSRGKIIFNRYPITFALLVLFSFVTISEASKEILKSTGIFNNNPWLTLFIGIVVLILTGTVYKKLNK